MVVVPGIQKFIIDCNWKIAVDNLFDWYHPQITHASAFQTGALGTDPTRTPTEKIDMSGVNMDTGAALDMPGIGIIGTKFDQVVVLGEYGHAIGGPTASSSGNPDFDNAWRATPQARGVLGPVGAEVAGHPNIFPTSWVTSVTGQLSLRIPRDPGQTEIWWFTWSIATCRARRATSS